jgi:hypothetical protein
MSHWLQDQASAIDPISRDPNNESLNQHQFSAMNLSPPPRTETTIGSMRMQRASPPKSPISFSQRTFDEFPKATVNQSPKQVYINARSNSSTPELPSPPLVLPVSTREIKVPRKQEAKAMEYPSPGQSTLPETNMLTLVDKLIDTQQATEQVLRTMVTTSQNQVIVFSNVENSVPTFAGDSTQAKAEAWLNSVNNAALSLNMPVESKLNFCDQYLTGAAKFWYNRVVAQKTVTTWPEFE